MSGHDTREVKRGELMRKLEYLIKEFAIYPERTEPIKKVQQWSDMILSFIHSFIQQIRIY